MHHYPLSESDGVLDTLLDYRQATEDREPQLFSKYASLSKEHSREGKEERDHRLPYKRDVDRIIHSKAFSRYVDKTQVVYLIDNDHVTHRSLHVQLVSNFARGIAEILRLNLDLVEAIALGHDVGHCPFGHEGEDYLSEISQKHLGVHFAHPWQSCRLFREIEPLNLGFLVQDGFLCHDGGLHSTELVPTYDKTWEQHQEELSLKISNPDAPLMPASLEGCLVKICDTMSYIGRDIEDAISLGILNREDIPETILGRCNRDILRNLATDIIRKSHNKDRIILSESSLEALLTLRKFNFKHIYSDPRLKVESHKVKKAYHSLYETLLLEYQEKGGQSHLWKEFLHSKSEKYITNSQAERLVIDYIAGMTDGYFVKMIESLILPTRINLHLS